jgi:hypothetical protein
MIRKQKMKLTLDRVTMRRLTDSELGGAAGGIGKVTFTDCTGTDPTFGSIACPSLACPTEWCTIKI